MKRSTSIVLLVIMSILIIIASVFTFIPFQMGLYDNNSVIGSIKLGIDLKGGVYVELKPTIDIKRADYDSDEAYNKAVKEEEDRLKQNDTIDGTINTILSRLVSKGYPEATVVKQSKIGDTDGMPRIRVEIPDVDDPDEVFNIIGQKAELKFMKDVSTTTIGARVTDGTTVLTGDDIAKAQAGYQDANTPIVSLTFTNDGATKFSEVTKELAGKGKLAIVVDDILISNPDVKEQISNGSASISPMNSIEEARNLAVQIESGSLPMKFDNIEPRTISATLGANALQLSLIAGAVGLALIFIFMVLVYRGFGVIADLALIIYVLILAFLLAVLPWVQLSIQGIAGIILSIGMAVDANVIVFERIKDEYKNGKNLRASVQSGFRRATTAILDSNITTIIAAVVMWIFGIGSIKGFAITLFIGIIVSLITSLLITRLLVKMFLPLNNKEKFYKLKRSAEVTE